MTRKIGRCCGSCIHWKKHGPWLDHWWLNVGTCSHFPTPFDLKANSICSDHEKKAKQKRNAAQLQVRA